MDIAQLLAFTVKNGASDLHLSAGLPPMIRVDGDVRRINVDPMDHELVHGMVYDIMKRTSPLKSPAWHAFVLTHSIITGGLVLFSVRFPPRSCRWKT